MAIHSSILAWKIPWMEEPGRLQSMGRKESDTNEQLDLTFSMTCADPVKGRNFVNKSGVGERNI